MNAHPSAAELCERCQRSSSIKNPLRAVTSQDGSNTCIVINHLELPNQRFSVRQYVKELEPQGFCAYICLPSSKGNFSIKGMIHFQVGSCGTLFALLLCINSQEFLEGHKTGPFCKVLIQDWDLVILIRVP